jgi:protein NrfC
MAEYPKTPELPKWQDSEENGLEDKGITDIERRDFLKIGLAVTGVFAAGTMISAISVADEVFATREELEEDYPYKPHYSMVIQQDNCIDCERCSAACAATNDVPSYGWRTKVFEQINPDSVERRTEFIPVLCNQCNNPACVRACPTKATYKDKTTGIIMTDQEKCIGCKTCMSACPYNCRYFNEEVMAVDKCNFCYDTRLSKGETLTACAEACPSDVRIFGDLSDPESDVFKIIHDLEKAVWVQRPETGTKPNVFYTTVR